MTAQQARERETSLQTRPASIGDLVKMEAMKLRKRAMAYIIMALAVLAVPTIMGLIYFGIRASNSPSEAQDVLDFIFPGAVTTAIDITTNFGQIALVVLAASIIGSEYSWGTMRTVVGSGVSRMRLYWAKVIALFEAAVVFTILGAVAGTAAGIVLALIGGHGLDFSTIDGTWLEDTSLMLVRNFFVMLFPIALGYAVASATRSFAFGIAVGIGLPVLESIAGAVLSSLGGFFESLTHLLPSRNMLAITDLNGGASITQSLPDPWQAAGVLVLYMAILLIGAGMLFRRRDIPSSA